MAMRGEVLGGSNAKAGVFMGKVQIFGDLEVHQGSKSAVVEHPDGSMRKLYALKSSDSWFEDLGRAEMIQGQAQIELDDDFTAVVRTDGYFVFLAPEGSSSGLYVSKSPRGFEVREQQQGTSDLTFSYRVLAKRKDVEAERFQTVEVTEPTDTLDRQARQATEPPLPSELPPPPTIL